MCSGDSDSDSFTVSLDAVRPSQLFLDGRKLALVTQWFDFGNPNYDPLPVRRFEAAVGEENWVLTDGHTRAFVAHLAGADELRVVRDSDDLDADTYRKCIDWCDEENVTEIPDLAGRVLSADEFEERWVARCQAVTDE
jgi:hypothetical protein